MTILYQNEILAQLYTRASETLLAEKTAIQETGGKKITYRKLVNAIESVAISLVQQGFKRGDRVLLLLRPNIDLLIIVLAVVRAGGTLVIADPAMGQVIFEKRVKVAEPKWVFADSLFLLLQNLSWLRRFLKRHGIEIPEMANMNIPHQVSVGKLAFLAPSSLDDMKRIQVSGEIEASIRDSYEPVTIVFTSGTTGQPKGVVHTVDSMLATLQRVSDYAQLKSTDVIYDTGILFILPALMVGATIILHTGAFNAEATVKAYRDYAVSKTLEIPAHMQAIVQYLRRTDQKLPATLEDLMLGAAPVFAEFLDCLQIHTASNTRIWSLYGMSEILPVALVSIEEKLKFNRQGGDLVGQPMEGIQAEIAEDGELILSGSGLFASYLGQERVSKHHTGDMARIDEQGRIVLLGRKKDMIIRGKYNIYPPLFEPTIRQIRGVSDAAMVGVYNPKRADEDVILFIQPDHTYTDLETLKRHIEQELLTGENSIDVYAQPDHIFFSKIPYSGRSQKLDKLALRVLARHLLRIPESHEQHIFEQHLLESD